VCRASRRTSIAQGHPLTSRRRGDRLRRAEEGCPVDLRRTIAVTLVLAACSTLAIPGVASAAAGNLDRSFGDGGKVITDITRANDAANDVAIQPNGKIVAVGRASTRRYYGRFAVTRYRTNGHLDPAFGGDGLVTVDVATREDAAAAVAIQTDGGIVAVGGAAVTARNRAFALVRLEPDGSRDAGFGVGGIVTSDLSPEDDGAADVAIQADQRIVVAGTVGTGRFAVARYGSDGSLDPTFSGDGTVRTDITPGYDSASALAIDADGDIVVAGTTGDGSFAVVRYLPDGTPDASFGGDGIVTTDLTEGYDAANGVAVDGAGRVVVAGEAGFCCEYTGRFGVVRYEADGTPDATFGDGGVVITNFSRTDDAASDLAIQTDGSIVVVGTEGFDGLRSRFAVARYTDTGVLDPTFGRDGRVVTSFSRGFDSARAVAIQTDGAIVAAGGSYPDPDGLNGRFAIARYHGSV
jgi:uncharacterized delta-60 repeat protein